MGGSAWPRVMPRVRTIKLSQEAEEEDENPPAGADATKAKSALSSGTDRHISRLKRKQLYLEGDWRVCRAPVRKDAKVAGRECGLPVSVEWMQSRVGHAGSCWLMSP